MNPEVVILQQSSAAKEATGLTVIIDVFRAFTTAGYFFSGGAKTVMPVAGLQRAVKLKEDNPSYLLAAERCGEIVAGADLGNSPAETINAELAGRTIIFSTSAGTRGFEMGDKSDELLADSFSNANAVIRYIQLRAPTTVSLVCMGHRDLRPSDEDTLCASYIKNGLAGIYSSQQQIRDRLRASPDAAKFFNSDYTWAIEQDFLLCTELDKFDFVMQYSLANGLPRLSALNVPVSHD